MIGTSYQVDLLNQMMKIAEMRHRVSSENIANINTPGYRALEVQFKDILARQRGGSTDPAALEMQVVEASGNSQRLDGNTVNIDQEMSTMTTNAIQFEAIAQLLASKMGMLRTAISRH